MQQRLHALSCHPDVTRFEIEDALLRQASADLLSEEVSISEIIIDLDLFLLPESTGDPLGSINSFFTISADDPAHAVAQPLAGLVESAAMIAGSWRITSENISELEAAWVGTATPGPKITAVFDSKASDSATFQDNIIDVIESVVSELGDVGSRAVFVDGGQDAPFSTAVSFWFASHRSAQDALDSNALQKLTEDDNISSASLGLYRGTEHRVYPNPNIWATTSGLQAPEDE